MELRTDYPRRNYLIHHGVTHEQKPGRVRVVCNASSVFQRQSLNGIILPGPNLLNDMPTVITRLREFPVWVTSDIVKFFHHVGVALEDQIMLSYLWSPPGSTGPPEVWCMTRQPFGVVSSPFLSLFCLNRCAEDNRHEFPLVVEQVKNGFYMDNYCDSFPSVKIAKLRCESLATVLKRGSFILNEWASNSKRLLAGFPAKDLAIPFLNLETESLPTGRMLGLFLDPNEDSFLYRVRVRPEANTKREILREVASQSDPLGFILPVTITARALLQDIWLSGSSWDQPVAAPLLDIWKKWAAELPRIEELRIQRLIVPLSESIELHCFGDASETACGAVLYARTEVDGKVYVNIIAAKAKVAPIKPLTIPKLELQAAVMVARLANKVKSVTRLTISATTYWTDSETTLRRIRSTTCRFQVYEANRIGEIKESTDPNQWRHVPGPMNPADDLSRGISALSLDSNHRFLRGPEFLYRPRSEWPPVLPHEEPSLEDADVKKPRWINAIQVGADEKTPKPFSELISSSTSLLRLKRIAAYVLRFVRNVRAKVLARKSSPPIESTLPGPSPLAQSPAAAVSSTTKVKRTVDPTVEELEEALSMCIRIVQEESFHEELYNLRSKKPVHCSSRLATLTPHLDKKGVMRVGGRLSRAPLPFSGRHPIILDPEHNLTRLIVYQFHYDFFHAKTEHILGKIRQHYLIIRGRRAIRNMIRSCHACKKRGVKPQFPFMGPLPPVRTTPDYPFTHTGVDYFGPLHVKIGRRVEKRWGVIYTCLATRAVHLDKAYSMTQDAFINSERRFVSVRGRPAEIWCDNGSNLRAGDRELFEALQEWDINIIERYMTDKGTKFVFSPPGGPWVGGPWERLIASCKTAIKVVLGHQTVTEDVLDTVLAEVAALMNGRPLTHVSVDPEDLEPLTPNHFLLLRPQPHLPPAPAEQNRQLRASKRTWRTAQALIDQFWARWMTEYVPNLIEQRKWLAHRRNLRPDDIVLVVEPNTPRGIWPIGRVVEALPGPDGTVRVVRVRTKTGTFIRPVGKLCLLVEAEKPMEEALTSTSPQQHRSDSAAMTSTP